MLTQTQVRQLLHYSARSGRLVWRRYSWAGHLAGWMGSEGVLRLSIDGIDYPAHSVVWLYQTGIYPDAVQHIDDDQTNLAWGNLRLASPSQRAAGQRLSVRNSSGYKGIIWRPAQQTWQARIKHRGIERCLGSYADPEDAARAYDVAAYELHGRFARLNFPRD